MKLMIEILFFLAYLLLVLISAYWLFWNVIPKMIPIVFNYMLF